MIGTIVSASLLFIFVLLSLTCRRKEQLTKTLIYHFVCSVVAPVVVIGQLTVSFEILSFPILILLCILFKGKKRTDFNYDYPKLLLVLFILMLFSSLLSSLILGFSNEIGEMFGTTRYILNLFIYIMLLSKVDKNEVEKFIVYSLLLIGFINAVFSIVQLFAPSSITIFYSLYYKTSQTYWYYEMEKVGRLSRAIGAMANSPYLGGFSLASYGILLISFKTHKYLKAKLLALIFTVISGLLSLSKTFILGFAIITILGVLFGSKNSLFKKIIYLLLIGSFALLVAFFAINGGYFNALNYFEFINNPLSALNTRYSSESALTKTFNFTMNNSPLFGLGFLKIPDIFAGDSSYLNIFYRCGMIGIIVMFLWYLKYIVINIFRDKKNFLIPVVVAVLLVFIGLNWTFRFESIIVWLVLMPKLIFEEEKHERYKIV